MKPAHVFQVKTPKGVILHGLWFGPTKPKRAIVLVHGLMSTAFSMSRVQNLVDEETAVITFNNRGFGAVNYVAREVGKTCTWILAGAAHEKFTDCVDDIEGVLSFVRSAKVKEIYLAGHSTGCQKSIYFASKGNTRLVKGIILLAPVSDYASQSDIDTGGKLNRAVRMARKLVADGLPHELMPNELSGEFQCDAQRFLSLYTPESVEEIFSYSHKRRPATLEKVRLPILVVLAENDEYEKRPALELAEWFTEHIYTGEAVVIPKVAHSFKGGERQLSKAVGEFIAGM